MSLSRNLLLCINQETGRNYFSKKVTSLRNEKVSMLAKLKASVLFMDPNLLVDQALVLGDFAETLRMSSMGCRQSNIVD